MPRQNNIVIITYNGLDGACAAAMALLGLPKAKVVVSSAKSIGMTLGHLAQQKPVSAEIHVCGLGVYCDWAEFKRQALALSAKGSKIFWYCGRGYLDEQKKQFAEVSSPIFLDCTSNTEAISRHHKLGKHPHAEFLINFAQHDPNIAATKGKMTEAEQFWSDLIDASFAEYTKYQDQERYRSTIAKLALQKYGKDDEKLVEIYRRSGFRYVMEGKSPALRKLRGMITKCAAVDAPILIVGETGVGKEHVAHLTHERGKRATEPLIAANCANFIGNVGLANSALFGHCKGAFTGATTDRAGAFQAASGGILFLDELGELPLEVQGKLLRVLEDKAVIPEGADRPTASVDVQLIAATHCDLPEMIRRGEFRADLYYRLATLRVQVPPLRERKEDLDAIIDRTLDDLAQEGFSKKMSKSERQELYAYDWPGNVRQLIQVLRRAVYLELPIKDVLAEERHFGTLETKEKSGILPNSLEQIRPIKEIERDYAQRALDLSSGNYHKTAKALGISVNTLRSWLGQE